MDVAAVFELRSRHCSPPPPRATKTCRQVGGAASRSGVSERRSSCVSASVSPGGDRMLVVYGMPMTLHQKQQLSDSVTRWRLIGPRWRGMSLHPHLFGIPLDFLPPPPPTKTSSSEGQHAQYKGAPYFRASERRGIGTHPLADYPLDHQVELHSQAWPVS